MSIGIIMSEQVEITIEPGLQGNVKVTIECRGRAIVNVWKMTEDEARDEAEEIARRMFKAA